MTNKKPYFLVRKHRIRENPEYAETFLFRSYTGFMKWLKQSVRDESYPSLEYRMEKFNEFREWYDRYDFRKEDWFTDENAYRIERIVPR